MTDASEWQGRVGESWASEWRRTDRAFGPLTERLLARRREASFAHALDVGCGAGELTLALARARPEGSVVGVDISPQLIAVARERGVNLPNADFVEADAAAWQPQEGAAPDLLISRHGVMFFDDPAAAFGHFAAIAAPGARLLFSCFRDRAENPFFMEPARLLPHPEPLPAPDAPGPFAFADAARVEALLTAAGWREVRFEAHDFPMIAGVGEEPIADALAYFTAIGPAARAVRELEAGERARFLERLRGLLQRHVREGIVTLRAAAWIVSARKP